MKLKDVFPRMAYLNLAYRDDRRGEVECRFFEQGLRVRRQPLVKDSRVRNARGYAAPCLYASGLGRRMAIRAARDAGAPALLLFDDDVVLHPQLHEKLADIELPEDWGIFYLGCQHAEPPVPVAPGLVRVKRAVDYLAVGFRQGVYAAALRAMRGNAKGRSAAAVEWALLQASTPAYACYPNLAWQSGGDGTKIRIFTE